MKTLREIRDAEVERIKEFQDSFLKDKEESYKYGITNSEEGLFNRQSGYRDGFMMGFGFGIKAAIEMLRSEEAELYQNEEREFYKQRVSPREWADYLEKMENSNG